MIERTAHAASSKDVSHTTSPPEVESSVEIGTNSPVPVRFLFWCNLQSYIFFGSKALWDKKKKNTRAHLCLLGPSKEYIQVDWRVHLSSVRQSGSWSGVHTLCILPEQEEVGTNQTICWDPIETERSEAAIPRRNRGDVKCQTPRGWQHDHCDRWFQKTWYPVSTMEMTKKLPALHENSKFGCGGVGG